MIYRLLEGGLVHQGLGYRFIPYALRGSSFFYGEFVFVLRVGKRQWYLRKRSALRAPGMKEWVWDGWLGQRTD